MTETEMWMLMRRYDRHDLILPDITTIMDNVMHSDFNILLLQCRPLHQAGVCMYALSR